MTDFFDSVLSDAGTYCIVEISGGTTRQRFYQTKEEAYQAALVVDANGGDAYYAVASFDGDSRKADDARCLRSFFLDIDCGPGKPYPDQTAGLLALLNFGKVTGLPRPTVVNSGGGWHVYWTLTADAPADAWHGAAKRLKELCIQHSLAADPVVTADKSRILRVPGTHNRKQPMPRPVTVSMAGVPSDFDAFCSKLPPAPVDLSAAAAYGADAMTKALARTDFDPTSFDRIVQRSINDNGCAQVAHAVREAATLDEPLWRGVLSLAWVCDDRDEAIRRVSEGHPDYTFEKALAKAAQTEGKPHTCQWFRANYPDRCKGCVQKITTPLALGRIVREAQAEEDGSYTVEVPVFSASTSPEAPDPGLVMQNMKIPPFPFPYFRGAKGGVFVRSYDAKGDLVEHEIYPHDLYLTERLFDSDETGDGDGECVGVHLHLPRDGIRKFYASNTVLLSKDKLRDTLVKYGVVAYGKELDSIMAYIAAAIKKLQSTTAASRTRNQMGWTDEGTFVIGEVEYTHGGSKLAPPASGTRQLAPLFHAKGTLAEWKSVINHYADPSMATHALGFFIGCGSPLLQLINSMQVRGAVVNLVSNASGTGKTTVQYAINSLFGSPFELILSKKDTAMSKFHHLGIMNSICTTVDEMTDAPAEEISALVYGATSGRAAHRMEAQTNRLRANHTRWCSIMVTSSNSVMSEILLSNKIAADGELKRVLDLHIPTPPDSAKEHTDALFRKLELNYGIAGPIFIAYVVNNRVAVEQMLNELQRKIDTDARILRGDRFMSAVMTAAIGAATIMGKLGLHDISIDALYRNAIGLLGSHRGIVATGDNTVDTALEVLAHYMLEHVSHTLIVNGNAKVNEFVAPQQGGTPHGGLAIRYEPDTDEMVIPAAPLRKFFVDRRVDFRSSVDALVANKIIKPSSDTCVPAVRRMTAGVHGMLKGVSCRCYVFDGRAMGDYRPVLHEDGTIVPDAVVNAAHGT